MGALGFTFVTPEAARAWVHKYYNNLLNNSQKLTDYPSNPNVAMVSGFMCAPTDAEAEAKAAGWTFFIFALSYYGRKGVDAPGTSDLWKEYQSWKGGPEEKKALEFGLIGSPETIRRKLRQFQASRVDQVILLNQAGKTSHQDICDSLELFAKEVMPEFHAAEAEHAAWKQKVLAREIVLEDLDVQKYDIYSHQNEHIVRLTPEQLKQKMAEKEAAAKRGLSYSGRRLKIGRGMWRTISMISCQIARRVDDRLAAPDAVDRRAGDLLDRRQPPAGRLHVRGHRRVGRAGLDQHHLHAAADQAMVQALGVARQQRLGGAVEVIGPARDVARDRADDGDRAAARLDEMRGEGLGEQHRRDGIDVQDLLAGREVEADLVVAASSHARSARCRPGLPPRRRRPRSG